MKKAKIIFLILLCLLLVGCQSISRSNQMSGKEEVLQLSNFLEVLEQAYQVSLLSMEENDDFQVQVQGNIIGIVEAKDTASGKYYVLKDSNNEIMMKALVTAPKELREQVILEIRNLQNEALTTIYAVQEQKDKKKHYEVEFRQNEITIATIRGGVSPIGESFLLIDENQNIDYHIKRNANNYEIERYDTKDITLEEVLLYVVFQSDCLSLPSGEVMTVPETIPETIPEEETESLPEETIPVPIPTVEEFPEETSYENIEIGPGINIPSESNYNNDDEEPSNYYGPGYSDTYWESEPDVVSY